MKSVLLDLQNHGTSDKLSTMIDWAKQSRDNFKAIDKKMDELKINKSEKLMKGVLDSCK